MSWMRVPLMEAGRDELICVSTRRGQGQQAYELVVWLLPQRPQRRGNLISLSRYAIFLIYRHRAPDAFECRAREERPVNVVDSALASPGIEIRNKHLSIRKHSSKDLEYPSLVHRDDKWRPVRHKEAQLWERHPAFNVAVVLGADY